MPADDPMITERSIVSGDVRYRKNGWAGAQLESTEFHLFAPRHDAVGIARKISGTRDWIIRPFIINRIFLFWWRISWCVEGLDSDSAKIVAFYKDIGLWPHYAD